MRCGRCGAFIIEGSAAEWARELAGKRFVIRAFRAAGMEVEEPPEAEPHERGHCAEAIPPGSDLS